MQPLSAWERPGYPAAPAGDRHALSPPRSMPFWSADRTSRVRIPDQNASGRRDAAEDGDVGGAVAPAADELPAGGCAARRPGRTRPPGPRRAPRRAVRPSRRRRTAGRRGRGRSGRPRPTPGTRSTSIGHDGGPLRQAERVEVLADGGDRRPGLLDERAVRRAPASAPRCRARPSRRTGRAPSRHGATSRLASALNVASRTRSLVGRVAGPGRRDQPPAPQGAGHHAHAATLRAADWERDGARADDHLRRLRWARPPADLPPRGRHVAPRRHRRLPLRGLPRPLGPRPRPTTGARTTTAPASRASRGSPTCSTFMADPAAQRAARAAVNAQVTAMR